MSLKAFHIVFIIASILLTLFFGFWCLYQWRYLGQGTAYTWTGLASLLAAVGLVNYLRSVLKKLKNVGLMVLPLMLLASNSSLACMVCYGDPDHAMTKGLNAGVLLLLGVIVFVLVMFASFFLYLRRRFKEFEGC